MAGMCAKESQALFCALLSVAFFTTRVYRRLRARVFVFLCAQILFALPEAFLNAHRIAINLCAQVLFALSGAFLRV